MANAAVLYSTCIGLERQLREELKHKNFYEAAVRSVRTQLRSAYEAVLFADYTGSQAREVEPALWKSVYYRPIEEFRRRIKAAAAAGERGREPLQKVKAAFGKFLQEGARFYRELALKLQLAFGDAGFSMADAQLDALPATSAQHEPQDCSASVYRCLICLGDIFRYEASVLQSQQKKDWSSAASHYRMAMKVYPQGGNSYNQLAVLSTYNGDDLAAVYFYFRSLAVAKPFTIARENLVLLLEQIRQKYAKLPQPAPAKASHQPISMKHKRPVNILMQEMSIRLAHLYGTLFSKVNLSDCDQILPAAISDVQDFLSRDGALQAFTHKANSPQGANNVLLKLAVLSIFSLYDVAGSPDAPKLGYADAVKQDVLKQAVLRVVQTVMAALAEAVAKASHWERVDAAVLPTLTILLEWWAATPSVSSHVDVPQPKNGPNPDLTARTDCLTHLTALVEVIRDKRRVSGSAGDHLKMEQAACAMAEDTQLRGFLPLQSCHDKLTFDQLTGQDATAAWLFRAQAALQGIADHPVNLPEGTAAQQPLWQAWQTFRNKVHPTASPAQQETPSTAAAAASAAAAGHTAAASATAVAAPLEVPASSVAGATDVPPGITNRPNASNGPAAAAAPEDVDDEEEEVILFRPQQSAQAPASSMALSTVTQAPSMPAPAQPAAVAPDSYAARARLGAAASAHQHPPQMRPQQQHLLQQQQQPQHPQEQLLHQQHLLHPHQHQPPPHQQQQQLPSASKVPEAYATGIAAVPPTLLPSSSLLNPFAPSAAANTLARPLSAQSLQAAQQQQQTGLGGALSRSNPDLAAASFQTLHSAAGQGTSGPGPQQFRPEHDPSGYAAAQQGSLQQRPASVPAGGAGATTPGQPARSFGLGLASVPAAIPRAVPDPPATGNDQLHSLSSLAHGLGSSAVGSPGYGQFAGPSPYGLPGSHAQPGHLGAALGQFAGAPGQGLYGRPGPSNSLFSDRGRALGSGAETGSYHPFGMQAGLGLGSHSAHNPASLSSQSQAAPGPFQAAAGPFQAAAGPFPAQSTHSSIAHSGQFSSAGSDRASPALGGGTHARTNLAAQMGFGSNPNLQSLDGLGMGSGAQQGGQQGLGYGLGLQQQQARQQEQLTWQQQLMAQQQSLQHSAASGMSHGYSHGSLPPGGFQNSVGHQLPPVPTWQGHLLSQQGQYGGLQGFTQQPAPAAHSSNAALGRHINTGQQLMDLPHLGSHAFNWQQQLQQQQASGGANGLHGQGLSSPYGPAGGGGSVGSASSPSAATAADSWSWLDAFEHKQQLERAAGASWPAPGAPQQGPALW